MSQNDFDLFFLPLPSLAAYRISSPRWASGKVCARQPAPSGSMAFSSHTKSKAHAHCNSRKHTSSSQLAKSVLLVGKRKRPHCHTATQSTYVLGRQPSYTRHLWNHAAGPQNLPQSKQRCLPHAKDSVGVWRSSIR